MSISAKGKLPLDLVDTCATNLFEYKHYDVNRRPRRTVKLDKIDAGKAFVEMEKAAEGIEQLLNLNPTMDCDTLCNTLTDEIYRCCSESRVKKGVVVTNILSNQNCNSKNYRAIAQTNFLHY